MMTLLSLVVGSCDGGPEASQLESLCDGSVGIGQRLELIVPSDRIELIGVEAWHGAACVDADCCANVSYQVALRCDGGSTVPLERGSSTGPFCRGPANEYPGGSLDQLPLPVCVDLAVCDLAESTLVGQLQADGTILVESFSR